MSLGLANFTYDSITGIFAFDATIQNDLGQVMGSPDGTTITGITVFFYSGPTCTGGSCYVSNADGTGTFTASNQPYFEYNQMLAPQAVSASKNWQIYVDPAVESFDFEIEAYAAFPAAYSVNQAPPDTLPVAYYGDTNVTSSAAPLAGELLKNVVVVDFETTAQLADRQLAIAKIGGTLIGGDQIDADSDGVYYVGVPSDSVASGVFTAEDTLMGLTSVADVSPEIIMPNPLGYVRPRDDSTSGWATWQVNPDSARGGNWGPEAVAAPLAWGCSTGDTSVLIGIADHGWHDVADTRANVVSSEALNVYTDTIHDRGHSHGEWVNSILAASGNNGVGIAGMVWTAKVARTETALRNTAGVPILDSTGAPKYSLSSLMGATERAIKSGAKIVNLSYWVIWNPGQVLTAKQVAFTDTTGAIFTRRLKRLAAPLLNLQPLIVLIAGNAAIDAATAGFPQAAADPALQSRIIVVGASYQSTSHAEAQAGESNTGSLVDVAAPGARVEGLNEFGGVDTALFGTSFAAPVVAGIAAELAAFDHTLSASDLKTLIVNGATNGGRTWGSVPIVNAYESLKLAAQRPGAPLCANRVYSDSTESVVYAYRTASDTAEALGTMPSGAGYGLVPLHGGRAVYSSVSAGSVTFSGSSWQSNSSDNGFSSLSGYQISAYNLSHGMDHDGDTVLTVGGDGCTSPITINIGPTGGTSRELAEIDGPWGCSGNGPFLSDVEGAYNPASPTVLVTTEVLTGAPGFAGLSTYVYSIPIASGLQSATRIQHVLETSVANPGFSEDGSEVWTFTARYTGSGLAYSVDFWDPATFTSRATYSVNAGALLGVVSLLTVSGPGHLLAFLACV